MEKTREDYHIRYVHVKAFSNRSVHLNPTYKSCIHLHFVNFRSQLWYTLHILRFPQKKLVARITIISHAHYRANFTKLFHKLPLSC